MLFPFPLSAQTIHTQCSDGPETMTQLNARLKLSFATSLHRLRDLELSGGCGGMYKYKHTHGPKSRVGWAGFSAREISVFQKQSSGYSGNCLHLLLTSSLGPEKALPDL